MFIVETFDWVALFYHNSLLVLSLDGMSGFEQRLKLMVAEGAPLGTLDELVAIAIA